MARWGWILMNSISPQDMERYRSRLAHFNLGAAATDDAIRSLHLVLSVIIDNEIRKSAQSRLQDSFLVSASHASLAAGQEPTSVDLAPDERSKGARNNSKPKKEVRYGTVYEP